MKIIYYKPTGVLVGYYQFHTQTYRQADPKKLNRVEGCDFDYHALIAEANYQGTHGGNSMHREFILWNQDHVFPEYLLCYERNYGR